MATTGGRGARGAGAGRARRRSGGSAPAQNGRGGRSSAQPAKPRATSGSRSTSPSAAPALPAGPFRLGAIEGATPGKWIDVWKERYPSVGLELVPLSIADQRSALFGAQASDTSGSVDAALVRLPIERTGLHVIALYDELAVVVCAADSHLTAADELTLDDLSGEIVIVPRDAPLCVEVPGAVAPRFDAPASVGEAIATVAAGVGVVIVPMSLARLHHRKDVAHRPLVDGPLSPVALAWRDAGETPPLVDAFIGIVRGRTANSSR